MGKSSAIAVRGSTDVRTVRAAMADCGREGVGGSGFRWPARCASGLTDATGLDIRSGFPPKIIVISNGAVRSRWYNLKSFRQ